MRQGEPGNELLLLLDGIVVVEVDGVELAELGPGAMLGERALLEGGVRTSTVTARTRCRFAVADVSLVDPASLEQLSLGHHREEHLD
jgi:CRP-like cAMP-binding protein